MAATSYAARLKPRHEKGGGLGNPECLDSLPVEALKAFQVLYSPIISPYRLKKSFVE